MSWIETSTGNRISRLSKINNPSNIFISENCTICEHVTLHGDVATVSEGPAIRIGKFTYLAENSSVDPPPTKLPAKSDSPSGPTPYSLEVPRIDIIIGNYTFIGESSVVRLIQVGNRVHIGARCTLGELSVINDCCVIEDDTLIPPKSVIPPYSRVSGQPGRSFLVQGISPAYRRLLETKARVRHSLT